MDCRSSVGHHRSRPPIISTGMDSMGEDGGGSTGGAAAPPVVDLIYAAKPYANEPGRCVDCGLNVKYSISITSNMRPTDERGRPMHGRPHAHPVGP